MSPSQADLNLCVAYCATNSLGAAAQAEVQERAEPEAKELNQLSPFATALQGTSCNNNLGVQMHAGR